MPTLIQWSVAACAAYLLLVYGAYAFMLALSGIERAVRTRGRRPDDYELVRESGLTIPASISARVYNEAPIVIAATNSFLGVDYPEYEVVIVNDGSTDETLSALKSEFELEPVERLYRRTYATQPIRGIYSSRTHPHLLVIDKENGGKADSLNCGLNFARYRYVCGVDGDTILARNALLDGMRLVLSDPARVIGITGHVAIHGTPEAACNDAGDALRRRRVSDLAA